MKKQGLTGLHSIKEWKRKLSNLFHSDKAKYRAFLFREYVLPVFYPRRCPVCRRLLPFGSLICSDCADKLPWVREPVCYHCGKPVSSSLQELCYDCRQFPKSFVHGISLLLYNEKTRPMIADFKYHNHRNLSRFFAGEILRLHGHQLNSWNPQLIVPVPVHKNKRKKRGYNQAALLARDLSALTGIPYMDHLLIRRLDTTPQKQLTPQARLNNLRGAFALNPECRADLSDIRTVLLIDDIYTTGATMEICSRVLISAGIRQICICTLCTGVSRD